MVQKVPAVMALMKQPFPGAVERRRDDKDTDFVTTKDMGALGNGTADDTEVLNNALANVKRLHFLRGNYRITKTLVKPRDCSISADPGANIVCDFSTPATWGGKFIGLEILGQGGVDVSADTGTVYVENLYFSSINAMAVQATAVSVPNGATGPGVLESCYHFTLHNINVRGFDTAYYFGQLRESVVTDCKATNVQVGVHVRGKCIGVYMSNVNVYAGTPATSSVAESVGFIVNSYNIGGVDRGSGSEERPEGIILNTCMGIGFTVIADFIRGLMLHIDESVLDASAGTAAVRIGGTDGTSICNNWIASGTGTADGVLLTGLADPTIGPMVQIRGNQFADCVAGVRANGRSRLSIVDNNFQRSKAAGDLSFLNVRKSTIRGNRSTGGAASTFMIDLDQCSDLDIDDNYTDSNYPLYIHPTNSNGLTPYSIRIGRNNGALVSTRKRGVITIAAGTTSIQLNITGFGNGAAGGWIRPVVRVLRTSVNVGFVNVVENTIFTTFTFSIAAVAPAGGVVVMYEIDSFWYSDVL